MIRILAALAAGCFVFGTSPASAGGGQLAIGEVVPLYHPPGYVIRPVYTPPVLHSRWTPADTSYGVAFREPVYRAPPGYVYRYVRGYTRQRIAATSTHRVHKTVKPAAKASTVTVKVKAKARRGSCVTELGYGRYDECP